MIKKIIPVCLFSLLFCPLAFAANDFSQMNPTVQIRSYKKLYTGNVTPIVQGSGTVIRKDGIILTNNHVVFDEEEMKPYDAFEICMTFDVKKEPVCEFTAGLLANNEDMDLAILKINPGDIFGNILPDLKFLSYLNDAAPKEQTEIRVYGYPGSGGKTITISKGQISGFEDFNGYTYFKTDTDFDHGSSGGTATNLEGAFIGVPTYLRSYTENVGFFLDLRDAREWITKNIDKPVQKQADADEFLIKDMARFSMANEKLAYTQDIYPYASIKLPEGWEFLEINPESFFVYQKNASKPASFSAYFAPYTYAIDEGYLNELETELAKIKKTYPDYLKEDVVFAGQKAWKITYTGYSSKNFAYYVPYGYVIAVFTYSVDLNDAEVQEAAIQPLLDAISFTGKPQNDPKLPQTVSYEEPVFEITMPKGWRAQKNKSADQEDLLVDGAQNQNFKGTFGVYFGPILQDERHLNAEERLKNSIENLGGRKLIYKNDKVVLGGLKGFLYVYEYEGEKYQEMRKHLVVKAQSGTDEFTIEYDDLTDIFDKNLPDIRLILGSFRFGEAKTDANSFGSLGLLFSDIQYHRYAFEIGELADKGIVKGYEDGGFHPEQPVSRAEALKMILESKNALEKESGSKKFQNFASYKSPGKSFPDVAENNPLKPYMDYATDKKFIEGYKNGTFRPDKNVTLTEALKLILLAYEIPIWQGETDPWFKKYMDKGFELGIVPYGLYDPAHILTRAELAYLLSTVYGEAK